MILLLSAQSPGAKVGEALVIDTIEVPYTVVATGGFAGDEVQVEVSPTDEGNDWITLATTLANGEYFSFSDRFRRIRAKTQAGTTGLAKVYFAGGSRIY